jgi:O-antigen/teichoic acid export membrane protein
MRTIDYSFISYPLSVRLCVANDEERARLLGNTVALTVALSFVLVMLMALGTTLLEEDNILLPACLCYLCWQAQETSRRFLLADFRYREAVHGDGVAYVGQVLLIAVLLWIDTITLSSSLYAMSATFAAGALVHASKVRFARPDFAEMRGMALEYFSVGKWSVLNYQLALVRVQLFSWLLAAIAGTAATASFQAGLNIANMMDPIIFGIGNAIPRDRRRAPSWRRSGASERHWLCALRVGPDSRSSAPPRLMPDLILRTVYGPSSPYLAVAIGLQLLVVAGILDYIAEMISKTLLGIQSGRLAFLVNVVAAVAALGLALALIGPLGVFGACLALLIANLMRVIGAVIAIGWLIASEKAREQVRLAADSSAASANQVVGAPAEQ